MREFVYYSQNAPTTGNFGSDLMKAGRIDITINVLGGALIVTLKRQILVIVFNI